MRKWYFEAPPVVEETPLVMGATFYLVEEDEEGLYIDLDKPFTKAVAPTTLSDFLPEVDE